MILLSPIVGTFAQHGNQIANMVEEAVTEYYDSLSTQGYQKYRSQMFTHRSQHDTSIYLYLSVMEARFFMMNMQNPDNIPHKIFYHTQGKSHFWERSSTSSAPQWARCRRPNASQARPIEVIEISDVDFIADTLAIHLTHSYYHGKVRERVNGRSNAIIAWSVAGGGTWKYVYSEERGKWICVQKKMGEI